MKLLIFLCALVGSITSQLISDMGTKRLMCYYNAGIEVRPKLYINDLAPALQFCTHLVYGYASYDKKSNNVVIENGKLDLDQQTIVNLKKKYPYLKVLLSVGGDKNEVNNILNIYLNLLDSDKARVSFINSVTSLLQSYNFDGLDIAFQLPKNKPLLANGLWKKIPKLYSVDIVIDKRAEKYKQQFAALIRGLRNALSSDTYELGVSVLPNVNSTLFYDVRALAEKVDYVNLMTFDFQTPQRNPEEADFPAPIYEQNDRYPELNVNYQVQYWLKNQFPASKINVGIATYGRAWKLTRASDLSGIPIVKRCIRAAPAGKVTQIAGLLSYPEICDQLVNPSNQFVKGANSPLRNVDDTMKCCGNYAFRLPDSTADNGMWVGYDDPRTAGNKAEYVNSNGLGGVALVDLAYDDFTGSCSGDQYPILRSIYDKLQGTRYYYVYIKKQRI